jgi:hypothetical protein
MKPDIPLVLADHAHRLAESIVPKLTGFDANGAAMMSAMLTMISEEWDRAAARRVEENAAIRAIFADALPSLSDAALAGRLKTLADGKDTDLRISALDVTNDDLRNALGALHAHVELQESASAQQTNEAIWKELRRSVDRRRLSLANF